MGRQQFTGGKYVDLGLVTEGTDVAANAIVTSEWFDDVDWVRSYVLMMQCDQAYKWAVYRRDTAGIADWGAMSGQQLATGASWSTVSGINGPASLGKSVKFGIRNDSAVVAAYCRARVQLMG